VTDERQWLQALEIAAPDVVAVFRLYDAGQPVALRRELRARTGQGTAPGLALQLDAMAQALSAAVAGVPERLFGETGGEADWTVAEAVGHDVEARRLLVFAAALAAGGRWPAHAPAAVPSVPGKAGATRDQLLGDLQRSRSQIAHWAQAIHGHETDPCPLDHPLVGHLRCGEWLLFAGVHDLMHVDQLHQMAARAGSGQTKRPGRRAFPPDPVCFSVLA
jgi:hypothetical protein